MCPDGDGGEDDVVLMVPMMMMVWTRMVLIPITGLIGRKHLELPRQLVRVSPPEPVGSRPVPPVVFKHLRCEPYQAWGCSQGLSARRAPPTRQPL